MSEYGVRHICPDIFVDGETKLEKKEDNIIDNNLKEPCKLMLLRMICYQVEEELLRNMKAVCYHNCKWGIFASRLRKKKVVFYCQDLSHKV